MARDPRLDDQGRYVPPGGYPEDWPGRLAMTAPGPRDEAPRWRWDVRDEGAWLVSPDSRGLAFQPHYSSLDGPADQPRLDEIAAQDRQRIVDTLNAGERAQENEPYVIAETVRLSIAAEQAEAERDALQGRVRVLEAALGQVANAGHLVCNELGKCAGCAVTIAMRALAGTEEGA